MNPEKKTARKSKIEENGKREKKGVASGDDFFVAVASRESPSPGPPRQRLFGKKSIRCE